MGEQQPSKAYALRIALRITGLLTVAVIAGGFAASGALARTPRRALPRWVLTGPVRVNWGVTAHGQLIKPSAFKASQSDNWSGYNQGTLEKRKFFHRITGYWTVPTATQHTPGQAEYAADWIGIGGGCVNVSCTATDSTLIQTGTEEDVSSGGTASYSAWWELIPLPSITITSMKIHPGDEMYASIIELVPFSNIWKITITDVTDGQSFTKTVPYSSNHDTAEWIEETPLIIGSGLAALPDLTSPVFDMGTINGGNADLVPAEEIQLVNSGGTVIADPSAPDPDNDGFNVCAWESTCAPPSSS